MEQSCVSRRKPQPTLTSISVGPLPYLVLHWLELRCTLSKREISDVFGCFKANDWYYIENITHLLQVLERTARGQLKHLCCVVPHNILHASEMRVQMDKYLSVLLVPIKKESIQVSISNGNIFCN